MPEATAQLVKPVAKESTETGVITKATTPGQEFGNNVIKLTDHLAKAGHPLSPEKVAAGAEADVQLAKVEEEGLGAKVVNMGEWLERQKENLEGDFTGATRIYTTEGEDAHKDAMKRMHKKAIAEGLPQKIKHLLFERKKEAA